MSLRIATPDAACSVDPALGAGVLQYRLTDGTEIFRSAPGGLTDPFGAGCFLMAPWCNRISGGITGPDGTRYEIAPGRDDFPLPIHGGICQRAWDVEAHGTDHVRLSLSDGGPPPFHYDAAVTYALSGKALTITLTVRHRGETALPYGMGLHPWFPRPGAVRITAMASTYQTTDARLLPTGTAPVGERPEWAFQSGNILPDTLIDTAFAGWDGRALLQRDDGWQVAITTDPALHCYQIYAPGPESGFFCFEPVRHPVDAHNAPGHPDLVLLGPGQETRVSVTFQPA